MGGPGHDFMENPQALEGGRAPRIAVCSKIGSLAGTALSTDTPYPVTVIPKVLVPARLGPSADAQWSPTPGRAGFLPDSRPPHCPAALGAPHLLTQRQKYHWVFTVPGTRCPH